jgi:hypothetical protein
VPRPGERFSSPAHGFSFRLCYEIARVRGPLAGAEKGGKMFDKGVSRLQLSNFNALNGALMKLKPSISGISSEHFQVRGLRYSMIDRVISINATTLYDGMKRADIIDALKPGLEAAVNNTELSAYTYEEHGKKHFPGGTDGSKFTADKETVNPLLITAIRSVKGAIRRNVTKDQNGKLRDKQAYYLSIDPNDYSDGHYIVIQIGYDVKTDAVEFHGYPDKTVKVAVLSHTKGGDNLV